MKYNPGAQRREEMTRRGELNGTTIFLNEPDKGLFGVCARSGAGHAMAAGGIRVLAAANQTELEQSARELADSMGLKCTLAGLPCDGMKIALREPPAHLRATAFRALGSWIESFEGELHTAGDLGTTKEDLEAASETTQYVHGNTATLSAGVTRTILQSMKVAKESPLWIPGQHRYVIQGLGDIGGQLAKVLGDEGVDLVLWDIDRPRADSWASETGGTPVVDFSVETQNSPWVWMPCAIGHQLCGDMSWEVPPSLVVGGANCIVQDAEAALHAHQQGLLVVPAVFSSAGAIIEGIGKTVLGHDCEQYYRLNEENCRAVFNESRRRNLSPWHLVHVARGL